MRGRLLQMGSDDRFQPDFDADEKAAAAAPRYQVAKEVARNLLKTFRIKVPPVDVAMLVRARGLRLVMADADSSLSGALYTNAKEIVINTRGRSPERQRFTIAHELGHWELS